MRSVSEIVADLERQIAWRSSTGKVQHILTINHDEAVELLRRVKEINVLVANYEKLNRVVEALRKANA